MAYHAPPAVWSRCLWVLLLGSSLLLGVLRGSSAAQITLDGSLGPPGPLAGPHYRIDADRGQIRGSNLFHSFGQFNVPTGGSATFTGPNTIANILSRVTGGQPSAIDGVLRSEIAGANLFLLNPAGVLFGPNASLDVSGSFHVSTADFLRFADGAKFAASLGQESVLTVASPAAFGFLGPIPAPITIQGGSLKVSEGKAVSVVGGDVTILGNNGPLTADSVPMLHAPSGRIQLASVASPGEVIFSPLELAPDLRVDAFVHLGRLELSQGAFLDASGNGGGTVLLRSGHLRVDGSNIFAHNTGPIDGAGVGLDLRITADAILTNGALLTTDTLAAGRAQDLRLAAGSVQLMDGSFIGSHAFSSGDGGNIVMNVGRLTLMDHAQISSSSATGGQAGNVLITAMDSIALLGPAAGVPTVFSGPAINSFSNAEGGRGRAGRVVLSAPTLHMENALINATAAGGGRGGDIEVRVGRLTLTGAAEIRSSAFGFEEGQGGDVRITATDSVSISGHQVVSFPFDPFDLSLNVSGISANAFPSGHAGRVTISTPTLTMDEGFISTSAVFGSGGAIEVRVGRLTLTGGAQIGSSTGEQGQGGDVRITATDSVSISGRLNLPGNIQGSNSPALLLNSPSSGVFSQVGAGLGNAGRVSVTTPHLVLAEGGRLAVDTGGDGRGGDLEVQVGTLSVASGAQITSSSGISPAAGFPGKGPGGRITIAAEDVVSIAGQNSGLFSETNGPGRGGDLTLEARDLRLTDGATISATSAGTGEAGTLRLTARDTFESTRSTVTTAATQASGGNIALRAGSRVQLRDSTLTTSVRGGPQTVGGDLTIGAPFVIAEGSRVIAQAIEGMGGRIDLTADVFLADPASVVSASSDLGIQGTVDIRAPVTSLSGTLAPLPQAFVNVAALLPARCAARLSGGTTSSLVLGGREGLPLEPGGLLPSPLALEERLVADPAVTGAPHRQKSAATFALLAGHEKGLPRLGCPP
jgi:filamentous hemagglutinin family protein